jgi:hypothetical protein
MSRAARASSASNHTLQRDTSLNDSSALQKGEIDFFRTLLDSAASRDSTAEVERCSSPWHFVHHFI